MGEATRECPGCGATAPDDDRCPKCGIYDGAKLFDFDEGPCEACGTPKLLGHCPILRCPAAPGSDVIRALDRLNGRKVE